MSAFDKWAPHLGKKIVAVQFDDGTVIRIDDPESELGGYLGVMRGRETDAYLRKHFGMSQIEWEDTATALHRHKQRETAGLPRSKVNKEDVEAHRTKYIAEKHTVRGWVKVATSELKIDRKTLKNIMERKDEEPPERE